MANTPNTPSNPSNNPPTRVVPTYKSPYQRQEVVPPAVPPAPIAKPVPAATTAPTTQSAAPSQAMAQPSTSSSPAAPSKPAWANPVTTTPPNHPAHPVQQAHQSVTPPFVLNTDPRLTDARTPIAHANSHQVNGSDPMPAQGLVQSNFVEVTVDTVSASSTFSPLLSTTFTTGAHALIIIAAGHISCSQAIVDMNVRLVVDGTSVGGGQVQSAAANVATPFALQAAASVTAGQHTISLEWKTATGNAQCRPISGNIDGECASIIVQEVTC